MRETKQREYQKKAAAHVIGKANRFSRQNRKYERVQNATVRAQKMRRSPSLHPRGQRRVEQKGLGPGRTTNSKVHGREDGEEKHRSNQSQKWGFRQRFSLVVHEREVSPLKFHETAHGNVVPAMILFRVQNGGNVRSLEKMWKREHRGIAIGNKRG